MHFHERSFRRRLSYFLIFLLAAIFINTRWASGLEPVGVNYQPRFIPRQLLVDDSQYDNYMKGSVTKKALAYCNDLIDGQDDFNLVIVSDILRSNLLELLKAQDIETKAKLNLASFEYYVFENVRVQKSCEITPSMTKRQLSDIYFCLAWLWEERQKEAKLLSSPEYKVEGPDQKSIKTRAFKLSVIYNHEKEYCLEQANRLKGELI